MGNLVYICESEGLHEVAKYWQMVVDMNEHQKATFAGNIISSLFNTVTNKKIAVLGFAFKKDTGDVRETPAISVCHMLMQDGAKVHVYDPKVKKEDALTEFKYHSLAVDENRLIFEKSAHEACDGAHAIVVLTEWDEFKTLPYHEFHAMMMKPAFLFDGRGILNHRELEGIGFEVHAIGKGRGPDGACASLPRREPLPERLRACQPEHLVCKEGSLPHQPAATSIWRHGGNGPIAACNHHAQRVSLEIFGVSFFHF